MKVELFSPWPPQRSGIADYAYRLAQGLIAHDVEVRVITAATAPIPLSGCSISTQPAAHVALADALPIFQLGNNFAFHAFQPAHLARLGGLVHLHDPVLHHFHVDRTLAGGEGGYWEDLDHWYGPVVADVCRRMTALGAPPWSNAAVTSIPLFEPYLQYADAVLVHSTTALHAINERMPALRAYHLPQSYPLPASTALARVRAGGRLRVGVFGWIEPHKRIDHILAAMAILQAQDTDIELDICGPVGATMRDLPAQIEALGLARTVRLRGHLDHARLLSAIADVDVCVNLRDPTMGETSAIVVQALQLGTPVIVSDTGWYSELPPCVLKVPTGGLAPSALAAHLLRLNVHRDELAALAEATRRFAAAELEFTTIVSRYVEIIAELTRRRNAERAAESALYRDVARALADLELADSGPQADIRAGLLRTITGCV